MTRSYKCPVCNEWKYPVYSNRTYRARWVLQDKDEHMRNTHGWCELCDKCIPRKLVCALKHSCRKNKSSCLLRYETPHMAVKRHLMINKHSWKKDIVIGTKYYDLKEQDIDRPCAKCGWNVHISEPHYRGDYRIEQPGVRRLVHNPLPDKPVYEDHYSSPKPLKEDYKLGGKYNKGGNASEGRDVYNSELADYESDTKSFESEELEMWKEQISMHVDYISDQYYGVNHYHPWCKNE